MSRAKYETLQDRVAVVSTTLRPYAILLLLFTVCNIVLKLIANLTRRSVAINKQT